MKAKHSFIITQKMQLACDAQTVCLAMHATKLQLNGPPETTSTKVAHAVYSCTMPPAQDIYIPANEDEGNGVLGCPLQDCTNAVCCSSNDHGPAHMPFHLLNDSAYIDMVSNNFEKKCS